MTTDKKVFGRSPTVANCEWAHSFTVHRSFVPLLLLLHFCTIASVCLHTVNRRIIALNSRRGWHRRQTAIDLPFVPIQNRGRCSFSF